MAKSPNQKLKLLYLKDFLERSSDEEHPITTEELIHFLSEQGISAERKTIYDDMEALIAYGVDVVRIRRGNYSGWYVASRKFQLPELRLLVDSVQSSRFITPKKSLELIEKIEALTSAAQAWGLRRQVWVKNRIKSMNESIYYSVDEIHTAITEDRQILFHYFQYKAGRERELRNGGKPYRISPFALLWDNENYYLVGYDNDAGIIKHFRVDKMMNIQDGGKGREGLNLFQTVDMAAYANGHFGMFSGKTENVRLEFQNRLAGPVLDRFGTEAMLTPSREGYFTVTVAVVPSAPFFGWLCTFGDGVRLLGPEGVVESMRQHIRSVAEQYNAAK